MKLDFQPTTSKLSKRYETKGKRNLARSIGKFVVTNQRTKREHIIFPGRRGGSRSHKGRSNRLPFHGSLVSAFVSGKYLASADTDCSGDSSTALLHAFATATISSTYRHCTGRSAAERLQVGRVSMDMD
ncbi:hypothetical protein NECAME_02976 [Necator americanus]|uniref:Uncharacterized protein n=1 Tax=Necator americanus TaxID=51031 RepID=W2TAI1_NECAM|nr:hypothetical protein NECAME_02976 [Necator americanus]ETN78017.1 hypothetical protein NECAME_02976 [Necator americanus]